MRDKPLTAAKVRSILRKAGMQCAKSNTTRIRGWRSWSPGFLAQDYENGAISVRYMSDFPRPEHQASRLNDYRTALTLAGLTVELKDDRLVVRATEVEG